MRPTAARATRTSIWILLLCSLAGCQTFDRGKSSSSTTLSSVYAQNERIQTQLAELSTKFDQLSRRVSQINTSAGYTGNPGSASGSSSSTASRTIVPEPAPRMQPPQASASSSSSDNGSFTTLTPVSDSRSGSSSGSSPRFASMQRIDRMPSRGRTAVRLPGAVLFSSGATSLNDSSRQLVGRVADVIQREYPDARVLLEGYADTDPISQSNYDDNRALSRARAEAVRREMIQRGIPADRIEAVGRGATNPKPSKALSRRVEVSVVVAR